MSLQWTGPTTEEINVTLNRIELATLREEQARCQLAEYGISFPDKGHAAWQRDYGQRKVRDWSVTATWVSTLGIIAVCLVLLWADK